MGNDSAVRWHCDQGHIRGFGSKSWMTSVPAWEAAADWVAELTFVPGRVHSDGCHVYRRGWIATSPRFQTQC